VLTDTRIPLQYKIEYYTSVRYVDEQSTVVRNLFDMGFNARVIAVYMASIFYKE